LFFASFLKTLRIFYVNFDFKLGYLVFSQI
jgi:hypothetical protein